MESIPSVLNWVCSIIILVHSINVLNHMTPQTNHTIRVMYCLFSVGAFGVFCGPMFGVLADRWGEVVINLGVVFYCLADRRRMLSGDDSHIITDRPTPAH